jgi:hypothetical protein
MPLLHQVMEHCQSKLWQEDWLVLDCTPASVALPPLHHSCSKCLAAALLHLVLVLHCCRHGCCHVHDDQEVVWVYEAAHVPSCAHHPRAAWPG